MDLSYDEIVRCLRGALIEVARNSRGFSVRARGHPTLLTGRSWAELALIEAQLGSLLEDVLRLELHVEPWSGYGQVRAMFGGFIDGLVGERSLVTRSAQRAAEHPVEAWRAGAPQLEADLWPMFVGRTHHLANTLALALDEPAPYPALIWNPSSRTFRS